MCVWVWNSVGEVCGMWGGVCVCGVCVCMCVCLACFRVDSRTFAGPTDLVTLRTTVLSFSV